MIKGWWQKEIAKELMIFFDDLCAGRKPVLFLTSPPQHGKECSLDTKVFTTNGWKKHGELKKGDYVFHPSGKPVKVLANIEQPEPCTLRVFLSNGQAVDVHPNHEWTVTTHDWENFKTIETKEMLKKKLYSGEKGKRGSRYLYQLPKTHCLEIAENNLKIHPYFLGVWLGDGCSMSSVVYEGPNDFEVSESLVKIYKKTSTAFHKKTNVKKHYFSNQGIVTSIRSYNLLKNKHIPIDFILSSKAQRLELLAGLIDTDGSLHKKTGQYRFINTNKRLVEDFKSLLSSLGYSFSQTVAKTKRADRKIKDIQDCYQIGFTPLDIIPCRMSRKKSNITKKEKKVSIVDIQEIQPVKGNCITVDSPDGLYLVGEKMIPTHNSEQIVDFCAWAIGKRPDLKTIFASFSDRLGVRSNLKIQRMMDSKKYREVFPEACIPEKNSVTISSQKLRNREIIEILGHDGYFRNTTVQGAVTGEALDLAVIDDPIKGREQANSFTIREKVWNWFTDDLFTRFSESAGLLGIMTRWHIDDPVGRLLESNFKVKILNYPALAEQDEKNRFQDEPLFPELKSKEFLLQRKSLMIASSWQSLYQGSPIVQDGEMFEISKFKLIDYPPSEIIKTVRYWDKAGTEGGGARTAGVRVSLCKNGEFFIDCVKKDQFAAAKREELIKAIAQLDGEKIRIGIEQEPGSGGKESAESTVKNLRGFIVKVDKVTGSKELRAEPYAVQVGRENVYLKKADWNKEFIDEHQTFPNGKYKDQVDATSGAFAMINSDNVGKFDKKHIPNERKSIQSKNW